MRLFWPVRHFGLKLMSLGQAVLLWLIVIPPEVSVSWPGSHGMTAGRKKQLVNILFGTTEQ